MGFCWVDNVPFPKSHFHCVGAPVDKSVNCTIKGAQPEVIFAEKLGTNWAKDLLLIKTRQKSNSILLRMCLSVWGTFSFSIINFHLTDG